MANLDEYWGQISQSDSFKDLNDDQKEKVRSHLFDQYVQKTDSYQGLPQSKRIQVKKHFDEITAIKSEGMIEGLERRGKKAVADIQPAIQKGKELAGKVPGLISKGVDAIGIDPSKIGSDVQDIAESGEEIPGSKKAIGAIKGSAEKVAGAIEPNFIQPSLTPFDMARAVGSGAVRTAGDFIAGIVPETTAGASLYFADPVFKFAGTTRLGAFDVLHPISSWKSVKTGLSSSATELGDSFEKIITQRRIENNAKAMTQGPPKPLEVLAHEEAKTQAQNELQNYEEWLKQAEQRADQRAGPGIGERGPQDIYPEAKTNVSQLRDATKERLRKLQNEPVRVESLGSAEDDLRGYFRKRLDAFPKPGEVIELPGRSVPRETQPMIAGPEKPAGLLKAGDVGAENPSGADLQPRQEPTATSKIPGGQTGTGGASEELQRSVFPGPKDQAFAKSITSQPEYVKMRQMATQVVDRYAKQMGEKPTTEFAHTLWGDLHEEINRPRLATKDKQMAVLQDVLKKHPNIETDFPVLNDQIRSDAYSAKDFNFFEKFAKSNYPIEKAPAKTYKEFLTDAFKKRLPNETSQTVDNLVGSMIGSLKDQGYIDPKAEPNEGMMKFLDEMVDRDPAIKGRAEAPALKADPLDKVREESGLPPKGDPKDLKQMSLFDVVSKLGKDLGKKGQIGGGDVDPVRQAAVEASIKELVDRAMALGYQTTQDIMMYAAKNAPKEIQEALRKNLAPTLTSFDTHAYKEMEEAKNGNPVAKKSLMDRAMQEYIQEKYQAIKGYGKRRKLSQIIGQFHDGDEALMRLKNDLFIHDNLRKLNPNEAAALRWHIEGKAPDLEALKRFKPEEEAKAMLEAYNKPTDLMKKAAAAVRPVEDEWHDLMSEFYDSMGYSENYVTRRWKQAKEYLSWEGKTLGDRVPFSKARKLTTHADGINAGYEPKSFDIRDDIRAANDVRVRILTRLHDLRKIAATFDDKGMPSIILEEGEGQASKAKITPHTGEAPAHWLRYQGVPLLRGMAINPDYKPAIDFIFGSRYRGLPIEMYEHLGSLSKASILGYSLFHPASLTEMLVGGINYRDVFTFNMEKNAFAKITRNFAKAATADLEDPLNWKNPKESISKLYKSFMSGHAVLANRPLALDMAEHGFKLGSVDDVNYNLLGSTLGKYETWLKAREASMVKGKGAFKEARETVQGIREVGDLLQKFIWDYQRPLFSMALYENHLADNIKTFNLAAAEGKKIPIDQLKFSTANMVSKMVGGISMGTLLVTPRAQQILQWAFMAPDWTIGRAIIPIRSVGVGATVKGTVQGYEEGGTTGAIAGGFRGFVKGDPETRQARKLMLRLGLSYFVFGNLLNYHNSMKATGKGRFMWENDPGHENELVWRKDDKGRMTYFQPSKAFTEIYDDLMHPAKTFAYKLNPNLHAAVKMFNWATTGESPKGFPQETPLQTVGNMFLPRTFSGQNAYGTFPVHKGVSKSQVIGLFDKYYRTGNAKFLDEATRYGMESGLDVTSLGRVAKANYSSQKRREVKDSLLQ